MIRSRAARGLLISGLLLGFGTGVSAATALVATGTKGTAQTEQKEGGTLVLGSPYFDYIDPALLPDPSVTAAVARRRDSAIARASG